MYTVNNNSVWYINKSDKRETIYIPRSSLPDIVLARFHLVACTACIPSNVV